MKKSVKYIIILLCLVIVALVSYIVVSKNFNTKDSKKQENGIENNNTNIVTSNDNESELVKTDFIDDNTEDRNKDANEAIRNALKDKKWLEDNLYPGYYFEDNDIKKYMEVHFTKISNLDGNPAYLVNVSESMAAGQYVHVVTYKDGKVYVSKPVTGEYSDTMADVNNNVVTITNDPTGITSVYKIENGEFVEFARADLNYNDNTLYYYVNGENVSYGRYKSYIEGCVEITTELTNENIDKYVK